MNSLLKNLFGGKKKSKCLEGGHILGGSQIAHKQNSSILMPTQQKDITFSGKSLGMVLEKQVNQSAAVKSVLCNSEADRAGVKPGYRILAFDGQPSPSYELTLELLTRSSRPCRITFECPALEVQPIVSNCSHVDVDERRDASLRAAESRTAAWEKKMSSTKVAKAQKAKTVCCRAVQLLPLIFMRLSYFQTFHRT